MTQQEDKCVAGCEHFTGGEVRHHKHCPFYPDSFSKMYDKMKRKREKYKDTLEHVLQLLQARRPHTPGLGAPINIIKSVLKQGEE